MNAEVILVVLDVITKALFGCVAGLAGCLALLVAFIWIGPSDGSDRVIDQ